MVCPNTPTLEGPWRITFETNPDLCNLHCRMCEIHSRYRKHAGSASRIMPISTVERVIASALPFGLREIIPSTMGEPLLYPHFLELLGVVSENTLKINLTTNGTFPRLGARKWAEKILPFASDTKVSVNGATAGTAESIMEGLDFKQQVANLEQYIAVKNEIARSGRASPTVTVQVTFVDSNFTELPDLLELAVDLGVDRFKGHHVWVTWPEIEKESLKRSEDRIEAWNSMVDALHAIAAGRPGPDGTRIRLENIHKLSPSVGTVHETADFSWVCPFIGKEAWISWDGRFDVCCAPDPLRKTFGSFGNVLETDFMDLWRGKRYSGLCCSAGNHAVCAQCNMKIPAMEGSHQWT